MGGRFKRVGTYVHQRLICVDVWQKTTKFCKAIILQLKNKILKNGNYVHTNRLTNRLPFSSAQFSCSVISDSLRPHELQQSRPPYHQLPESTQTHVHEVGDDIQTSHPLSSPSPALNLTRHQGLFQWVSSLHQVAKVLEFQLQHQCFQWTPKTDLL